MDQTPLATSADLVVASLDLPQDTQASAVMRPAPLAVPKAASTGEWEDKEATETAGLVISQKIPVPKYFRRAIKKGWIAHSKNDLREEAKAGTFAFHDPRKIPTGRFGTELLYRLGLLFSSAKGMKASWAQSIIDSLSASSHFRSMVSTLDTHYEKSSTPGILIVLGGFRRGSKFMPGAAKPDDLLFVDAAHGPELGTKRTSPESGTARWVATVAHETAHAATHAGGATTTTLHGFLDDEVAVRNDEITVLTEASSGTTDKALQGGFGLEAPNTTAGGLSRKDAALSLASGNSVSYLENFYLDEAQRQFATTVKANLDNVLYARLMSSLSHIAGNLTKKLRSLGKEDLPTFPTLFEKMVAENIKTGATSTNPGAHTVDPSLVAPLKALVERTSDLATLNAPGITATTSRELGLLAIAQMAGVTRIKYALDAATRPTAPADLVKKSNALANKYLSLSDPYDAL